MTIQLKTIKHYSKLTPSLRTSRGTDEAAADTTQSVNSSRKIYVSYITRVLVYYVNYHYIYMFLYFGYNKYGQNL